MAFQSFGIYGFMIEEMQLMQRVGEFDTRSKNCECEDKMARTTRWENGSHSTPITAHKYLTISL